MPAFKDEFDPKLIDALGRELTTAWPEFPMERWTRLANDGLTDRELLERAVREKMSVHQEIETAMPHDLINAKRVYDIALQKGVGTKLKLWDEPIWF